MKYLIAFFVFSFLSVLFIVLYYFNSKIDKPNNCDSVESGCEGCKITFCVNKKKDR